MVQGASDIGAILNGPSQRPGFPLSWASPDILYGGGLVRALEHPITQTLYITPLSSDGCESPHVVPLLFWKLRTASPHIHRKWTTGPTARQAFRIKRQLRQGCRCLAARNFPPNGVSAIPNFCSVTALISSEAPQSRLYVLYCEVRALLDLVNRSHHSVMMPETHRNLRLVFPMAISANAVLLTRFVRPHEACYDKLNDHLC